ncbi:unnamed protein product [Dovyalis caffra]|uniref:Uncharacterized protein n=1 Tax=Dovyalis caffra TaxID=77055 RepID=A0AAV1S7D4_9ROSI|nr:unnamed protein product [Dovyalis caffra]
MSSKKRQAHHGFYPLNKSASSDQFPDSEFKKTRTRKRLKSQDNLRCGAYYRIGRFHRDNLFDGSTLIPMFVIGTLARFHRDNLFDGSALIPMFVIGTLARSTSSLSEKSLEICTESLGSETGSDGFTSYPSSETGDTEEDKEEEQRQERVTKKHFPIEILLSDKIFSILVADPPLSGIPKPGQPLQSFSILVADPPLSGIPKPRQPIDNP